MFVASAPKIRRRGFGIIDKPLSEGPVLLVKNNKPAYVMLTVEAYREMEETATLMRIAASDGDIETGRVRRGNADCLMAELDAD